MSGHGHVTPNADGSRARCGGPDLCRECAREKAALEAALLAASKVQWASFWGGPDPDNAAGWQSHDDKGDAHDDAQWRVNGGVAHRTVTYGPWVVDR